MFMSETISIIRISGPDFKKRLIAQIPLVDGEVEISQGQLRVEVGKVRKSDQHQKIILSGSAIPTIQQRGDRRYKQIAEFPRRVVNMPPSYEKIIINNFHTTSFYGVLQYGL